MRLLAEMNVPYSPKNSISKLQLELLGQSVNEAENGLLKDHHTLSEEVKKWLLTK